MQRSPWLPQGIDCASPPDGAALKRGGLTVSTPPWEVENAPDIASGNQTPEHRAAYTSYYDRAQHWLPKARGLPNGRAIWDALNKKKCARRTGTRG